MTEWETIPLGELVDLFDHKRVPLSSKQRSVRPGPYPYYGAQGVIDHIDAFIFDGRFILIPEDGENLRSRKLPIAYFAEGQFWVNNHAHIVKAKPGVAVDRFVQGALEATDIGPFVTGAAQPKLSQANLRQIPLQVPPLERQITIASILDALDDLIENNRQRVEVLEEMARAIYREWFVHFRYPGHEDIPLINSPLGPIPAGWHVEVSGELQKRGVLEIGDGYRAKNSEMSTDGAGLPFVRVANVQDGYLALVGADELPMNYVERLRSKVSVEGDVVISMKGTIGRQALVDMWHPRMAYSPQVSFWRSLAPEAVSPAYLYEWIRSEDFIQQCAAVKGATDMADYVNLTDQRRMHLLVPSGPVMAAFTERSSPTLRLMGHLRAQSASLVALRDLLLPKLVTGEIDVSHLDLGALGEAAIA